MENLSRSLFLALAMKHHRLRDSAKLIGGSMNSNPCPGRLPNRSKFSLIFYRIRFIFHQKDPQRDHCLLRLYPSYKYLNAVALRPFSCYGCCLKWSFTYILLQDTQNHTNFFPFLHASSYSFLHIHSSIHKVIILLQMIHIHRTTQIQQVQWSHWELNPAQPP